MTNQFHIRQAHPEDGQRIIAMLRELASYEGAGHSPLMDDATLSRDVFGEADTQRLQILVATLADAELVGVVTFFENYSSWEGKAGIHICDLWVEPDARGQGLGGALIEEILLRNPDRRIDVFVLQKNPARKFYEALEFIEQEQWCIYRRLAG